MKRKETRELEYLIYNYFYLTRGLNCALEVQLPGIGRPDFVGLDKKSQLTIVEIKVTKADFKSINGHNLMGHYNYYAMPLKLYNEVKEDIPSYVGVIVPKKGKSKGIEIVKKARNTKNTFHARFYTVLTKNIETAKQSNIRRLLYYRYFEDNK